MLHADPHPGNFRILAPRDGEAAGSMGGLGIVDYGAVARLPERSLPRTIGSLIRIAMYDDYADVLEGLRAEGFVKPNITIDPGELRDYLSPFIEPARPETFAFSREWMREQFQRLQDPRQPGSTLALRLNLPPSYLLIHRVWVGSIGVLCQLEAELPFRAMLEEALPGFTEA
jgi:predicted unusual protein kinase regulating ubiquinone biosynthesis (AarF/ABC1/UbiB family)